MDGETHSWQLLVNLFQYGQQLRQGQRALVVLNHAGPDSRAGLDDAWDLLYGQDRHSDMSDGAQQHCHRLMSDLDVASAQQLTCLSGH